MDEARFDQEGKVKTSQKAYIRQMISQYLKENWCWGLQNDECECACEADSIMPHLECPNECCKAVPLDSEPEWSSDMAMEETWA